MTAIAARPMIFTAESVRGILAGRKTQTRRLVKEAWDHGETAWAVCPARQSGWIAWFGKAQQAGIAEFTQAQYETGFPCPYGAVGDRLWVREPYAIGAHGPFYRADTRQPETVRYAWRNSMFMPRRLSRLTLTITGVRAERLQDITERDAKAEGIREPAPVVPGPWRDRRRGLSYRRAFADLWDSIHGKKHPWSAHPWVWVIQFRQEPAP